MGVGKKGYDFVSVEGKIAKFWDVEKVFVSNPRKKPLFSIDTPPPTVSGSMHIGHAFSYAQQDFIARFRRMNGGVFYPFGTDDNGLPTERLVERLKKVSSKKMSRADFIALCLKTLSEITSDFVSDWKRLGVSADYSNVYSTIDDRARRVSQSSFIDLFTAGFVYKAGFPTLWCPVCQTGIAQAELEDVEKTTSLVYIKAKLADGRFIVYATTRPELHPGCIGISIDEKGVYVNAKRGDETWVVSKDAFESMQEEFNLTVANEFSGKDLVGLPVTIPFAQNVVSVSHDVSVKTEYGTGVVYYCSYGGLDCVQWLTRHPGVEAVDIMGEEGVYTVDPIEGLNSLDARKKIIKLLEKSGSLVKQESLKHAVNTHDKCGTDIEYISAPQWFIKIMDKKDALIKQGDKIKWFPAHMKKRYQNWVGGLEWDWNISRNRHFGVPIPVWHCEKCDVFVLPKKNELPIDPLQVEKKCSKCGKAAVPESMVLDTWATSSLTPEIVADRFGSFVKTPFSLRPQGHDIIRTWAFYTITRSFLSNKSIPWKDIVISGMVTRKGEKMSKSKGNGVDPKDVMAEFGADALRFWAAGSKLGSDLDYQEQDLIAGKKTVNKLVNASKFVFMNIEGLDPKKKLSKRSVLDEWFLERLDSLVTICTEAFEAYEYSKVKLELERFFWKEFCDNYLEIVKKRVYQGAGDDKLSAQKTLYESLFVLLKLFAPIMPFVTEELYQTYFRKNEGEVSVHKTSWPIPSGKPANVESSFWWFTNLLSKIRQEKTNAQKSMNSLVVLTLPQKDHDMVGVAMQDLRDVANAQDVKVGEFKVEFVG